ncbi:FecR family protein [Sphingobacterium nematocida]|uniref:FecR family protein n=1 Tax=Sphingobacterium nematocida TaxID=1513896 RepID=A0A1T5GRD3_9SPHI|nr:FecR family protein [Sphingobacterium nematocida]SKC10973.1 FecR family protein [Sphingobacterium nematocida]
MESQKEAERLIKKYIQGDCSDEERAKVDAWLNSLQQEREEVQPGSTREALLQENIWSRVIESELSGKKSKRFSLYKWSSVAALLVVGTFLVLYYSKNKSIISDKTDVSSSGAVTLVLESGERMNVDSNQKDELLLHVGLKREERDGRSLYKVLAPANGEEIVLRTIVTGKQEQIQVELLDGTKVWLNADSELKFPQSFAGKMNREVSLKGEGYFDVAKDKQHPFKVHSGGQSIEVLGTQFNLNAYMNTITTSLLEGAVKIDETFLKPGERATWSAGKIKVSKGHVETDIAWKDGYLSFLDDDIMSVCNKLKYWYDVDFVFIGELPKERLNGTIALSNTIQEAIHMLEKTSGINFKVEGRKIIVNN